MASPTSSAPYPWRFHRVGGLDQVQLDRADDLRNLDRLDQKLWVALACPTKGLEIDPATLALLDADKDGRVRAPEVIAAVKFADLRLKDLADIVKGKETLPLADIREDTPEGRALLAAARQILAAAGKPEAKEITLDDVADLSHVFEKTLFNGDGVVVPESAPEGDVRQVIVDAMACEGDVADRSGKPGLDRPRLETFYADLADFDAWWKEGRGPGDPGPGRRHRRGLRRREGGPAQGGRLLHPHRPGRPRRSHAAAPRPPRGGDCRHGRQGPLADQRRGLHAAHRADRGRAPHAPAGGAESRLGRRRGGPPEGRRGPAARGGSLQPVARPTGSPSRPSSGPTRPGSPRGRVGAWRSSARPAWRRSSPGAARPTSRPSSRRTRRARRRRTRSSRWRASSATGATCSACSGTSSTSPTSTTRGFRRCSRPGPSTSTGGPVTSA